MSASNVIELGSASILATGVVVTLASAGLASAIFAGVAIAAATMTFLR